jgi:hypothetical protein
MDMAEPIAFALPKKPRIKEKDAPPDQRKLVVVPIRACSDRKLTEGSLRVLLALCSYCNRAGITWVGQQKLGQDLGISRQAVTKQMTKLVAAGYVEVIAKGFRGARANTIRVIFDSSVDAETAMAVTSRYEDTRPPAIREQQEREMTETIDQDGQRRIAQLVAKALKNPNPKPERTMPKSGETRAVREVKEAMAKAKAKRSGSGKAVSNQEPHKQPSEVANVDAPIGNQEGLHRQPHWQPPEVARTQEEHIEIRSIGIEVKDKVNKSKTSLGNLEVVDFDFLIDSGMKPEQVEDALGHLLPLFAAEGLNPSSRVLADAVLQLHRDAR